MLKGGFRWLIQDPGEEVTGLAVWESAAYFSEEAVPRQASLGEPRLVLWVVNRVVPTREMGALETERARPLPVTDMPLADKATSVATLPERLCEGHFVISQVFRVAHVPFVVC